MPRFGLRSMLLVIAVAALWFSTFTEYPFAPHVRRSIVLLVFSLAVLLAIYWRGRWRAFWISFSIMMFLAGTTDLQLPLSRLGSGGVPQTINISGSQFRRVSQPFDLAVSESVEMLWAISLSTVAGFLGVQVHDYCRKDDHV